MINIRSIYKLKNNDGLTLKKASRSLINPAGKWRFLA